MSLTGGTTQLTDGGALTLGTLSTGNLTATSTGVLNLGSGTVTGTLAATSNNGAITQSTGSGLTVTGTSNLQAGTGAITLTTGSNDFQQAVGLVGGVTQIVDANALQLSSLNTGALSATSTGALTLGNGTVGGALTAISHGGVINQTGTLNVTGNGTINAGSGAIALGNNSNDFTGGLSLTGTDINVHDRNNLSVTALSSGANSAVDLFSNATLTLSAFAIDTGTASLRLASNGGALSTAGSVRGGTVSLRARDGIGIGHNVDAGTLILTTGNTAVTQTAGDITVAGVTNAGIGTGALSLTGANNDFVGRLDLAAGSVQLNDRNDLSLGALNTGALAATSHGALTLGSGRINGNLSAGSNGGPITQTSALIVTGTGALDSGSGATTLINAGNDFQGAMSLAGNGISVRDTNDLTVAGLAPGSNSAVSLLAGGTLSLPAQALDTGTGDLSLISLGGALSTAGSLAGNQVTLRARDALSLGHGLRSGGTLTLTSDAGAIVQTGGAIDAAGSTTATAAAGSGAISLAGAGNDFRSTLSLVGGDVQVTDSTALTLDTLTTGSLTVTSAGALQLGSGTINGALLATSNNGAISQSTGSGLTVAGTSTLQAGTGAITLTTGNNDFRQAVSLTGGTTQISDSGALTLGTLSTGDLTVTGSGALNLGSGTVNGALVATSNNGAITQSTGSGLTITGTGNLQAGTGAITLTTGSNDFRQAMSLTGGTTQIVDGGALTLGALTTGALTATSNGALNLGSGTVNGALVATSGNGAIGQADALIVTGAANLDAGSGAIALDNANNDFRNGVSLTGTGISVRDRDVLTVSSITNGANGAIALTAGGTLALPAQNLGTGTGALSLTANGGALSTLGSLTGGNISLRARDGLTLDHAVTASGTLGLTATNGAITQNAGVLDVGGLASVDAGAGAISLTRENDFRNGIALTGRDITVVDANDLSVTSLDNGGAGNIALTARNALSLPATGLTSNGAMQLRAENGTLALGGDLVGDAISLFSGNALTLATSISSLTGNGTLSVSTNNSAINQNAGILSIGGTSTFNAGTGSIALGRIDNDFRGAVNLAGSGTLVRDSNALTLGTVSTGALTAISNGALALGSGSADSLVAISSGHAVTQAGALTVRQASAVIAGSGSITLDDANNDFQSGLTLAGSGITVQDRNDLTLASLTSNSNGNVAVTAGGSLTLPATSVNAGGGNLSLIANGGSVNTGGSLSGRNVTLSARDGMTLGHSITATDTLTLSSTNAAIDQVGGTLLIAGNSSINAGGGAITLDAAGNDFQGLLALSGGASNVRDANTLTLGALDTGALTVTSNGALRLGQGTVNGALTASSNGGAITQAGALVVNGTSTLNAGNGAITLSNANNDFQGTVGLTGNGISVTDTNMLLVSSIGGNTSGTIALTAQTLNLPASAISAGTGTFSLTATGSAFSTGGNLSGGNVVVDARDGLTLAHDINAGNNLTLRSTNAAINQTAGQLTVGGTTNANAGTAAIALTGNNDFQNAVTLTGGAVQLNDRNALTVGAVNTGALTVTSNGALNLGQGAVNGALVASSTNGAITQTGALNINGTSTLNAGSGAITLDDTNNDFADAVTLTAGVARIVDANALTLDQVAAGALDVRSNGLLNLGGGSAGSLSATSNGGAIGQAGALAIAGDSLIDAGAGAVTLNESGNDFGGALAVTAGNVQLRDVNALSLATSRMDAIAAVAGSDITQTGVLSVSGNASFDAGVGAIALVAPGNDFGGAVSLRGGTVGIADTNALTLGQLTTSMLDATSRGDLNLGSGVVAGTLSARSNGGAIRQDGSLRVLGDAVLDAGSGAITLTDPVNDLAGKLTLNAAAARIRTGTPLTLGMLNVGELSVSNIGELNLGQGNVGTLAASSYLGGISQTGPLVVLGSSNVEAAFGDIRLDNVNNDFVGPLSVGSRGVTVTDRNALTFRYVGTDSLTVTSAGALNLGMGVVRGDLRAISNGGAIDQDYSLWIGGASMLDAGTGTITLADRFNNFEGGISLFGGASQIVGRNALRLDAFAVSSLSATSNMNPLNGIAKEGLILGGGRIDGTLTAISYGGDIVQRGALSVGGAATFYTSTASFNAEAGSILLTGNNTFAGAVSLTGGATQLNAGSALTLGEISTGALTVTSNGALDLGQGTVNGALVASSASDGITQTGALNIAGTSTLNAGSSAITLNNANNDFAGAVTAAGSGIVLVDRNDLQVASVQSSGNASVSLDAGGALQLPTSAIDVGTGALSLTARGGTLTTTHALRGGDVQLSGANGIALGEGISASGTLSLRSTNAAITQNAGMLQVAGNSVVDAGSGAITLDAAGNDFQGLLALTGGATRVRDANALTLDALDTGALNVASNGAIDLGFGVVNDDLDAASNGGAVTQTGALTVTGATRINSAGAAIALADAGNDFQSALSLSGGDTRVRDRNGLTLGTVDVGALDAASGAGLNLGQGRIGGALVARSGSNGIGSTGRLTAQAVVRPAATGADITQQGALTIVGNSVLDAGTGAIVLTDAGNDFQGSVQASGGSIAIVGRNDLAAAAQASGTVDLQAGGQFSSSGAIAGSTVALGSGGALQLGHDLTAGTVRLRSGGAITQRAGSLRADQLGGSAAAAATLSGAGNAIGTLTDFSAQGLDVFSATTLQVSGRVDGGNLLRLGSGGSLLLEGQLSGATSWLQAAAGIGQRAGSTLTANLLGGSAAGPVALGDAGSFIDNRVVHLGNFTASNGFSLTNAGDLTLVLSDGSIYSVDAGNSALLLSVRGDLLQDGRASLRDGTGSFSATGRIGTQQDPIYLIGTGAQTIGFVGAPPAYFNATTADGRLLDLSGGSSFNVPASAFAGRAQSSASRTIAFVDLSASGTPYRAFGLVRPGLRLPDDQQPACDAGDPDAVCTPQ
ncbi:hypothetical protein LL965_03800 [Xanthomonas cassavae CFBP 4642]|uniref:Autotransporter domain-containing protein n=1 Tax=Xanthomonas cassavae CFBP 4642 TaxID=1219375 RepID=A0ABS8HAP7_9XANT|nr:hypothetical protein [Xanthomonas cassavae]MCC4619241.1 hypothetical protein [Xanthomonas cassavae CFBP 4642]